ncbi:hypothetical protein MHYP_G00279710, partial [Metynnis hypsauchen]
MCFCLPFSPVMCFCFDFFPVQPPCFVTLPLIVPMQSLSIFLLSCLPFSCFDHLLCLSRFRFRSHTSVLLPMWIDLCMDFLAWTLTSICLLPRFGFYCLL